MQETCEGNQERACLPQLISIKDKIYLGEDAPQDADQEEYT